jgi:hypothetical protein
MGLAWLWLASLVMGLAVGFLAHRRGRDPVRWGALGFFFGPLVLPFLCLVVRRRR